MSIPFGRLGFWLLLQLVDVNGARVAAPEQPRAPRRAIFAPTWNAFYEAADSGRFAPAGSLSEMAAVSGIPVYLRHLRCASQACSSTAGCPGVAAGKTGIPVAIKEQTYSDEASRMKIMKEKELMQNVFNGSSFPKLLDSSEDKEEQKVWLMMEAAKSDLSQVKADPLAVKARLFAEAMCGVSEIHRLRYIHRDLKPDNIFISDDARPHALIGDFGTVIPDQASVSIQRVGTPLFMPLEVYENLDYSPKQDTWSMGLVLYELLFDKLPDHITKIGSARDFKERLRVFDVTSDPEVANLGSWLAGQSVPRGVDKDKLAADIRKLLAAMLERDPDARISAPAALTKAQAISETLGNEGDITEERRKGRWDDIRNCPEIWNRF